MRELLAGILLCGLVASTSVLRAQDKGTLYIYRLRVFGGGGRRMTLSIDGELFAYLQNGRFLVVNLPDGKHILSDKLPADNLELDIRADRPTYIRCEWATTGPIYSGFNVRFSESTKETGESDVRRLKPGDKKEIIKDFR